MLSQFQWMARGVKGLMVLIRSDMWFRGERIERMGLLPEMLTMAAVKAPNLEELTIYNLRGFSGKVLGSVGLLGQIKRLGLGYLELHEGCHVQEIQCLTGLQNLEVGFIQLHYWNSRLCDIKKWWTL